MDRLPASTRNSYPFNDFKEVDEVVIHCDDPRFREAFDLFIKNELKLTKWMAIAIPGGIHDFLSISRPKTAKELWKYVEFTIKERKAKKIIVINHADCAWYKKWNALVLGSAEKHILSHLLEIGEILIQKKFGIAVECYLAEIEGGRVVFKKTS
jgi:hypothetical protein